MTMLQPMCWTHVCAALVDVGKCLPHSPAPNDRERLRRKTGGLQGSRFFNLHKQRTLLHHLHCCRGCGVAQYCPPWIAPTERRHYPTSKPLEHDRNPQLSSRSETRTASEDVTLGTTESHQCEVARWRESARPSLETEAQDLCQPDGCHKAVRVFADVFHCRHSLSSRCSCTPGNSTTQRATT